MECAHLDENVLIAVVAANQQQTISPICAGWLAVYLYNVTFVLSRALSKRQSVCYFAFPISFDLKL